MGSGPHTPTQFFGGVPPPPGLQYYNHLARGDYLSNRPHFLSVYRCNNPLGMFVFIVFYILLSFLALVSSTVLMECGCYGLCSSPITPRCVNFLCTFLKCGTVFSQLNTNCAKYSSGAGERSNLGARAKRSLHPHPPFV